MRSPDAVWLLVAVTILGAAVVLVVGVSAAALAVGAVG